MQVSVGNKCGRRVWYSLRIYQIESILVENGDVTGTISLQFAQYLCVSD